MQKKISKFSLTLSNVDDHAAGKYRCLVTNRLGSIQNDFQLLIRGKYPMLQVLYFCQNDSTLPHRRIDLLATISGESSNQN